MDYIYYFCCESHSDWYVANAPSAELEILSLMIQHNLSVIFYKNVESIFLFGIIDTDSGCGIFTYVMRKRDAWKAKYVIIGMMHICKGLWICIKYCFVSYDRIYEWGWMYGDIYVSGY